MISNILKQILLIYLCYNFVSGDESCTFKKDSCKCEFSSGKGYDLGGITGAGKFLNTQKIDNITYLLHLCGDIQELPQKLESNNNCSSGYSICQFNETVNMSYVLVAKWEQATMKTDSGGLVIEYLLNDKTKVATVKLECTPNSKDNLLYKKNDSGTDFILYSHQGCITTIEEIHGYGFFQILVIILITVGFSYLFLGMLVKYFLVGARGMEIIPNLDFWNKVGRSIRLGWIYVKNGCRIIPSEDSYDAI